MISIVVYSQENQKIYKLVEVDNFPVFENVKTTENKDLDRRLFNAKIQHYLISNFNPKLLLLMQRNLNYSLNIRLNLSGSVTLTSSNIDNEKLKEEFARIVSTLKVKEFSKKNGEEVSVEFILPIKIKFKGVETINN